MDVYILKVLEMINGDIVCYIINRLLSGKKFVGDIKNE